MDNKTASKRCNDVIDSIKEAVVADNDFIRTLLTGLMAKGHVLIEDVPGTGKTLIARSLADSFGISFGRIQFTPDLLPSDITGTHIYNKESGDFEFKKGPIFANVVLADEINRAPPKTQAALLEAMEEKQVTVDNKTYDLPKPFFVIATQNPVEEEGTFILPEAQRDRFMIKAKMGYPSAEGEKTILERRSERNKQTPKAENVLDGEIIPELQMVPEKIEMNDKLKDYIIQIGRKTREDERVKVGVSPRGIQRLFEASRAWAMIKNRDFVVPDDIKNVAKSVLTHRLILEAEARVRDIKKSEVAKEVLDSINVPEVNNKNQ